MNWYFWFFAVYALWITPIHVHVSVRMGDGVRYRVRVQAAGLPVVRHTQEEEEPEEKLDGRRAVKGMFSLDGQAVMKLWRDGQIRRVLRPWRLESLWVHARISQADAAQTALLFSAARTALQSLLLSPAIRRRVQGRIQADFQAQGSQLFVRCIFAARLGNLVWAAVRFAAAIRQIHTRLAAQEEKSYAASH